LEDAATAVARDAVAAIAPRRTRLSVERALRRVGRSAVGRRTRIRNRTGVGLDDEAACAYRGARRHTARLARTAVGGGGAGAALRHAARCALAVDARISAAVGARRARLSGGDAGIGAIEENGATAGNAERVPRAALLRTVVAVARRNGAAIRQHSFAAVVRGSATCARRRFAHGAGSQALRVRTPAVNVARVLPFTTQRRSDGAVALVARRLARATAAILVLQAELVLRLTSRRRLAHVDPRRSVRSTRERAATVVASRRRAEGPGGPAVRPADGGASTERRAGGLVATSTAAIRGARAHVAVLLAEGSVRAVFRRVALLRAAVTVRVARITVDPAGPAAERHALSGAGLVAVSAATLRVERAGLRRCVGLALRRRALAADTALRTALRGARAARAAAGATASVDGCVDGRRIVATIRRARVTGIAGVSARRTAAARRSARSAAGTAARTSARSTGGRSAGARPAAAARKTRAARAGAAVRGGGVVVAATGERELTATEDQDDREQPPRRPSHVARLPYSSAPGIVQRNNWSA